VFNAVAYDWDDDTGVEGAFAGQPDVVRSGVAF
jgi:hypothetical protein